MASPSSFVSIINHLFFTFSHDGTRILCLYFPSKNSDNNKIQNLTQSTHKKCSKLSMIQETKERYIYMPSSQYNLLDGIPARTFLIDCSLCILLVCQPSLSLSCFNRFPNTFYAYFLSSVNLHDTKTNCLPFQNLRSLRD